MSTDDRIPIGEVLRGLEIYPMPEGWTAMEAFVRIKSLDDTGVMAWSYRTTNKLNKEEILGILTVQREAFLQDLLSEWEGWVRLSTCRVEAERPCLAQEA